MRRAGGRRVPAAVRWVFTVGLVASWVAVVAVIAGWRDVSTPAAAAAGVVSPDRGTDARRSGMLSLELPRLPTLEVPGPPTHPAHLDGLPARRAVPPIAVRLESLDVEAPVIPVGADPATGEMEIPPDGAVVGWYAHGPSPGEPGSAVLAGHVDYDGHRGALFDLARVEPGARITVVLADGTERRFTVSARQEYVKTHLPAADLFARDGPPGLVLVTCGGAFDSDARSYEANVVVYAVPG